MQLPTFQKSLAQQVNGKKSLLLGNGFSMAWKASAFSYVSLRKKADLSALSCDGKLLFDALETNDFEIVIERLEAMDRLLAVYDPRSSLSTQVAKDASIIRDALAKALAVNHPDNVSSIPDQQYAASREFLKHFACIYSVNYDLLLYWSTLQTAVDSLKMLGTMASDPTQMTQGPIG
jgi:hypothetical protein